MSTWIEIKHQCDVELSEDGKTIDVLYYGDSNGNHYIEIPVDFVKVALSQKDTTIRELNPKKS